MKLVARFFILASLAALLAPLAAAPQHDAPRYAVHTTPQAVASARRVWVRVELLDPTLNRVLPQSDIQADAERILKQAGVVVVTSAQAAKTKFDTPLLEIGVDTNNDVEDWFGYCVSVRLREGVVLARSPRQGIIGAVTWEQRDVGMVARDEIGSLKDVVRDLVQGFLLDYQKTHPGIRVPREKVSGKVPDA